MKRIAFLVSLFFFFFFLSANKIQAETGTGACGPVNYVTNPPKDKIDITTPKITVTITGSRQCFDPNLDYSYAVWQGTDFKSANFLFNGKPSDDTTFVAEVTLLGERKKIGTWNFSLWLGRGSVTRNSSSIILDFSYEIKVSSTLGNPAFDPPSQKSQVNTNASFTIINTANDQDYTYWWDGETRGTTVKKELGIPLNIKVNVGNTPGIRKLCLHIGGVTAGSVVGLDCDFPASVTVTTGPVPSGGPRSSTTVDPCAGAGTSASPEYVSCKQCIDGNDPATNGKPGAWTALGCISTDPQGFVSWLLGAVIGIAGGIVFLLILYGGFQILTSTGDPEKLNNGKEIIVSAIAGLLMIVFSVLLLKIIGVDILKIPGFQ